MKQNYRTTLLGSRAILVPYFPEHVATYHSWMTDPYLLDMTGSEPLTMEEEIKMQQSWRDDENKCTFIILSKRDCNMCMSVSLERMNVIQFAQKNLRAMVGDVNLFLSESCEEGSEEDEIDACGKTDPKKVIKNAELDVMIAVENFRREGIGTEATLLMMVYGIEKLGIERFFVKIKGSNTASRALFEHKLGFVECNYAACFDEYELEYKVDNEERICALRTSVGEFVEFHSVVGDVN